MAEGGEDFRKEMLLTGVYGLEWPKFTYLIVDIKNGDETTRLTFRNDQRGHAEIKMLNDEKFKKLVGINIDSSDSDDAGHSDDADGVEIIMTMNYSPCFECAPNLKEFYTNNKRLIKKNTIRFAHPYTDKKENKIGNENGLKDLNKAGITLEAMDVNSWGDIGIRFEELDADPDWEEKIRKKIWLYQKKNKEKLKLDEVKLRSNWKKRIKEIIAERDKQTKDRLKDLLKVEELAELLEELSLSRK